MVHNQKCIRNNWFNIKFTEKYFAAPCFACDDVAMTSKGECTLVSFNFLKHLHSAECNFFVKFVYKLFIQLKN